MKGANAPLIVAGILVACMAVPLLFPVVLFVGALVWAVRP